MDKDDDINNSYGQRNVKQTNFRESKSIHKEILRGGGIRNEHNEYGLGGSQMNSRIMRCKESSKHARGFSLTDALNDARISQAKKPVYFNVMLVGEEN